jgi:hypothetical protein
MIFLTLSYEVYRSRIVQYVLGSLRIVTAACYLATLALMYLLFVFQKCSPVILWHIDIGHAIGEQ